MEIVPIVLSILEIMGMLFALLAIGMGLTKGREAIKLTGGGLVEVTVTYLMAASVLYLLQYSFGLLGALGLSWIFDALRSIIAFGMGVCFFMIFKRVIEHLDALKEFAE